MFVPVADRAAVSIPVSLALLCCFAVAPSLGQAAQSDDQPRKISGTVVNAVTRAPIPRALVVSSDNRMAKLTDGEGHFEFSLPTALADNSDNNRSYTLISGTFNRAGCGSWLSARKPGFLDRCQEPGASTSSTFSEGELTISLVPEAVIYGRVTLPNNEPLGGTDLQLFFREVMDGLPRWMPRNSARTNSAGEFRFAELGPGDYKLLTRERADDDPVSNVPGKMFGYPPVFFGGAVDFASAPPIRLLAGQTLEADFSIVRQPYYRVNIPISNDDITTAGLQVTVQAQTGPGYSLGYNRVAKRIEGFLPNGVYTVEGTSYATTIESGSVNLRVNGGEANGPAMTLVPSNSIPVDVKEQFTKEWNGSSSWSTGKRTYRLHGPRAYLNVQLQSADDNEPGRGVGGQSQPKGPNDESIAIENVPPGRYWLRLNTGRGYVASARMGNVDLLRQPLVVTPGFSARIEVELRDDTAEIDGSVTGLATAPIGAVSETGGFQAWVYCVPLSDSPGQFRFVATADAQFSDPGMAPGGYRILAFASPQNRLPYRDAEAMKAYESKGTVVNLSAGQKLSVQVPLISDSDSAEK